MAQKIFFKRRLSVTTKYDSSALEEAVMQLVEERLPEVCVDSKFRNLPVPDDLCKT
jgi:hypothetical protein